MRKSRAFLFASIVMLFFAIKPNIAKADHCAGGEVIYEWISDSTYRFFFKFYRDCTGIDAYGTQDLCCYNSCTNSTFSVTMNRWLGTIPPGVPNGSAVSAGCSLYPTKCTTPASNIPGYQEFWFSCIVTLPLKCNYWKFSVSVSARNTSTNVSGGGYLYLETTFNNTLPGADSNSSPYFSIKPVPYCCVNQPYSFNNGAVDPNGDSLVTDVMFPQTTSSTCPAAPFNVTMQGATPAYSIPSNPIQTNNSFNVAATSGQLTFTPTLTGNPTLTVRVREYRNGVLMGSIMRDVQVQVLVCSTQPVSVNTVATTVTNGAKVGNEIRGCTNLPLSFCFDVKSADTSAVLVVEDNHHFVVPNATITYTHQADDSVRGCFNWTPGIKDTGVKNIIVTVKDSTCRPPGIMVYQSFVVPIYIWPPTRGLGDTTICPGGPAYLSAKGGSGFQWSVLPGGDPITSLSCVNCTSPVAKPFDTTYYVVTSTANPYCGNSSKDTVRTTVLPGPSYTKQPDPVTCPHNPVQLDIQPNPPTGVTYSYKWKPSTYLSNDTIYNPISNPNSDVTYIVEIRSSNTVCKGYDTISVDVLDGFKILTPDTAICEGGSVNVNIVGDPRYTFSWSTPSPAGGINNPNIISPTITPGVTGKYKYTLTATYALCATDSVSSFYIDNQPIPSVTVDEDAIICFGDTMKLHGIVKPATYPYSLNWTPGVSLDKTNVADPIFTANVIGNNTLTLTASSSAGCADSDAVTLTVFKADFLRLTNNDTALCSGDSLQLNLNPTTAKTFGWYPTTYISNAVGTNPYVWPPSTQTYYAYGIDSNNCTDTAAVKVTIKPTAIVSLPDSVRLYPGESYQMNPEGNCLYFSWFPTVGLDKSNISNPVAKPDVNTKYIVRAATEYGCTATDEITILVMPDSYLEFPNAFTPGSGTNGTFKAITLGNSKLKSFIIYNRWGTKVFETSDINKGWDGKYNNELQPMGVYIYTVEAVTASGRTVTKQGNMTLVR